MTVEIGARYRHYKNGKTYTVLLVGYFTEANPLLECVVYQAEYSDTELGDNPIFIRPKKMFEESVDEDGEQLPRFSKVVEI